MPETSPTAETTQNPRDEPPVGLAGAAALPAPAEPDGGGNESVGTVVLAGLANQIADDLAAIPVVTAVPTLLTMQLGPGEILVAAKVDFDDDVTGARIEEASDEAERRLRARYPGIRYVFLDPTRGRAGRNHRDGGVDL
ncbi:hypothetical protein [Pseudosporangium ferrugineum]|uniref:Cation efflux protein cytoplasmic domain-containing protein n=1 Tax=Pseudosporangium ferrugineum TaxID=439699 RepID=A0A2T0SJJ5_9ACTN|nr:hypothetical protein CLV70_101752 [Pseudosporangium ferrugineum]